MDPHFYWYLARAAGVVAFCLVTFSTALGLCISSRLGGGFFEKAWIYELHKFAALLALGFVGVHIIVLLPDPWTSFGLVDLIVPGAAPYRPFAVGAGVLAMYGALIGTFSFYIKRWIGYRTWRTLHYTTFGTFGLMLLHGVLAGTDSSQAWLALIYATGGVLVFGLTLYRILIEPPPARSQREIEAAFPAFSPPQDEAPAPTRTRAAA
jgi:predicted ferric reductase